MRHTSFVSVLVALALALSEQGEAQQRGRILHRPIPGDLPVDDTLVRRSVRAPASMEAIQRAIGAENTWRERLLADEPVIRPRTSWDAPLRQLDRQTRSAPGTQITYREVFTPAVAPFKRSQAYDQVDELGRITVRDPSLRPLPVGDTVPRHWGSQPRTRFVGEVLVELSPRWPTPIPGVAGEQRVVDYTTSSGQPVAFATDSAGNLFVRGLEPGTVQLTYVLEAPESAFYPPSLPAIPLEQVIAQIPEALRPFAPSWLRARVETVLRRVEASRQQPFADALARLVGYFRAFRDAELTSPPGRDLYSDLALGGVGACRHRAYAMMLTLHALGIPARYVGNEAHAWVEVFLVPLGWTRIDLGGWDVSLETVAPADRTFHQPLNVDPFPRPAEYLSQYSARPFPDPSARRGSGSAHSASGTPFPPSSNDGSNSASEREPYGHGRTGEPANAVHGTTATRTHPTHNELPAVDPNDPNEEPMIPTVLTLGAVRPDPSAGYESPQGFVRGSMVTVEGLVRDHRGVGIGGLVVQVELLQGRRVIETLATTVSRPDGRWETRLLLPARLEPGEYTLRAVTPGDARHTPASAE